LLRLRLGNQAAKADCDSQQYENGARRRQFMGELLDGQTPQPICLLGCTWMRTRFPEASSRHPRNPQHRSNSNEPMQQSQDLRRISEEGKPSRKLAADADFAEAQQDAAAAHWTPETELRAESGK
jgi:hypothetical protein